MKKEQAKELVELLGKQGNQAFVKDDKDGFIQVWITDQLRLNSAGQLAFFEIVRNYTIRFYGTDKGLTLLVY